jgi:predicted dehydrogenase
MEGAIPVAAGGYAVTAKTIRIGIVGCGNVMDGVYMPLIEKLRYSGQPVEVVAACHTKREKCQQVLGKWGIRRFTEDYRELVSFPDVDLVVVLTSMPAHGPIACAALRAGKHVLVEKPLATSLDEAGELVKLAKNSRGLLICAPFVALSPTFQTIGRRVRRGDIGRVHLARARYGWSGPDWAEWFYQAGGGSIFDLAVYNIASLTLLLGPARRVIAMTGVGIPERVVKGERVRVEVEDNAQILLDFGESVFGVITSGFTMQKYRSPAIELYGSKGTLQMLGDDWAPDGYELWQNEVGAWQVFEETNPFWTWADGLRHLIECIQRDVPPLVMPEHAFHVLEIMMAAQTSGRQGRSIEIESTFPPLDFSGHPEPSAPAERVHDRRRE